jgi:hypothetical protein
LQVYQEKYCNLLSFLAKLTLDAPTSNCLQALAKHAISHKRQQEKLNLQTTARVKKEWNTFNSTPYREILIYLDISSPEAIQAIGVSWKQKGGVHGETLPQQAVRKSMLFRFNAPILTTSSEGTDVFIQVQLQPNIHWKAIPMQYIEQDQTYCLAWQGIETNWSQHWDLDVYRSAQIDPLFPIESPKEPTPNPSIQVAEPDLPPTDQDHKLKHKPSSSFREKVGLRSH